MEFTGALKSGKKCNLGGKITKIVDYIAHSGPENLKKVQAKKTHEIK